MKLDTPDQSPISTDPGTLTRQDDLDGGFPIENDGGATNSTPDVHLPPPPPAH